jgi:hypothetical protein
VVRQNIEDEKIVEGRLMPPFSISKSCWTSSISSEFFEIDSPPTRDGERRRTYQSSSKPLEHLRTSRQVEVPFGSFPLSSSLMERFDMKKPN